MGIKERWNRYRPLPEDILERIESLGPFFRDKGIRLVYLFGSLVKGKGEDVDIALLYDGDISVVREELQKRLSTWRLDIVNLKNAPVYLAFEVISSGEIIYKKDIETENSFELNIIKRYQDSKPIKDKQLKQLKEHLEFGI